MSNRPYPDGIDCVWLASDRDGHLGAFITAGDGPIPATVLQSESVPVEDIEGLVCNMPIRSQARFLVSVKHPESFSELAVRGIFIYDWTDAHRTSSEAINTYELIVTPVTPIKVDMLPTDLADVAKVVKFANVVFADVPYLDVRAHTSCSEGNYC